jgi:hypothetical protein
VCVMRRPNRYLNLMEPLIIANDAVKSRTGGGVKIAKIERKLQASR